MDHAARSTLMIPTMRRGLQGLEDDGTGWVSTIIEDFLSTNTILLISDEPPVSEGTSIGLKIVASFSLLSLWLLIGHVLRVKVHSVLGAFCTSAQNIPVFSKALFMPSCILDLHSPSTLPSSKSSGGAGRSLDLAATQY